MTTQRNRRPKPLSKAAAQKKCREWNMRYPIGSPFRYEEIVGIPTEHDIAMTRTRSEAWTLGHGEVVVLVHGKSSCVSVDHLTVIDEEEG